MELLRLVGGFQCSAIEVLASDTDAHRSAKWRQHVQPQLLQEVVGTYSIKAVEMMGFVHELRDGVAVTREMHAYAEIRAGSVVVITWALGHALARLLARRWLLFGRDTGQRNGIHRAQGHQAAPAGREDGQAGRQLAHVRRVDIEGLRAELKCALFLL
jgi:hypothetical protein